jgi:pimeloyl-ACP methyl ester carboxylesterase
MSIQTQLCTFKTADNQRLHGLLFTPSGELSDLALVFVHGVAMNFYLPPLAIFGQELAQRRYHCFVINTRGHDWIARAENLTKFGGSAYENLDDCLFDLDAALDYLHKQGYRRFVLVGHSLGAIKSIIYQGTRQRVDVVSIVSCSAPKQFYSERVSRQPGFLETIEKAETMVAEGRGGELLSIAVGATPESLARVHTWINTAGTIATTAVPTLNGLDVPCSPSSAATSPSFFTNTRKSWSRRPGQTQLLGSLMEGIIFTIGTRQRLSKSSISGWRSSTVDIGRIMFPRYTMSWISDGVSVK